MSADTDNTDGEEQMETTSKSKRVVIYPDGFGDMAGFLGEVQDEYSTTSMKTESYTTTTYMMSVGGNKNDINEDQFQTWNGVEVDGVRVWEKEEEHTERRREYSDEFIAKKWIASMLAEHDIGDIHRNTNSTLFKAGKSTVLSIRARIKDVPMVKKLPDQEHGSLYEDEHEELPAIVVNFVCKGFPVEWEGELNEAIGKVSATIQKSHPVEAVRPVNCFKVTEEKTVCPRV